MTKKPVLTITISLIAILITFIAPLLDSSIYSFNGHPTNWMSFMPSSPFRNMGLGFITSPFIHLNFEHLAVNLFFFIPIGMMIERKKQGFYLPVLFTAIHLQVLLAFILINQVYFLENKSFIGTSHIVIGLYCFWFLKNKNYYSLLMTFIIIGVGLWQNQSPFTIVAHGLGLLIGFITFFIDNLLNKLRLKSSH